VEQLFSTIAADCVFEILQCCPGLQPQRNLGSGFRGKRIPALGFSAGLTRPSRLLIVGMHLYRELVAGEKEFHQQWKTVFVPRRRAHKITAVLFRQFAERTSRQRPIRDPIVLPREPALANWLLDDPGVDGPQIADTPGPFVEDRDQQERVEVGHGTVTHWRRTCAFAPIRAPGFRAKLRTPGECGPGYRSLRLVPQPRAPRAVVCARHPMPSSVRRVRNNG